MSRTRRSLAFRTTRHVRRSWCNFVNFLGRCGRASSGRGCWIWWTATAVSASRLSGEPWLPAFLGLSRILPRHEFFGRQFDIVGTLFQTIRQIRFRPRRCHKLSQHGQLFNQIHGLCRRNQEAATRRGWFRMRGRRNAGCHCGSSTGCRRRGSTRLSHCTLVMNE